MRMRARRRQHEHATRTLKQKVATYLTGAELTTQAQSTMSWAQSEIQHLCCTQLSPRQSDGAGGRLSRANYCFRALRCLQIIAQVLLARGCQTVLEASRILMSAAQKPGQSVNKPQHIHIRHFGVLLLSLAKCRIPSPRSEAGQANFIYGQKRCQR